MKRIILCGAAGSGKDFFRDYLAKLNVPYDVSYTTRPPRDGEEEGHTYNYISEEEFVKLEKGGFFLEAVNFNGKYYGTSMENWNTKEVFIMTPSGLKCIPKDERKDCFIIYFDIPLEVRKERLSKRSDWDSVDRRIKADEEDFKDFNNFDLRVTNSTYSPMSLYVAIDWLKENVL
jgi:guanylate kinase